MSNEKIATDNEVIDDNARLVKAFNEVTDTIEAIRKQMITGIDTADIEQTFIHFTYASDILDTAKVLCGTHEEKEIHKRLSLLSFTVLQAYSIKVKATVDNSANAMMHRLIKHV